MRMELIQPFINSADAVFGEALHCATHIGELTMDEHPYERKGLAALVAITGEIEGRVIVDVEPETAARVASQLGGGAETVPSDELTRETVCELANLIIGNAVTTLNDRGFQFKVHPPEFHASREGLKGSQDTEAIVLRFETGGSDIYVNIAMRYCSRRKSDGAHW